MNCFSIENEELDELPIVISIPHSGTFVPKEIKDKMIKPVILPNSDWFLQEFYSFMKDMHMTIITSNINRYVIDLNRPLHAEQFGDYHSLVYEYSTQGKKLYDTKISDEEIAHRIQSYYLPYHEKLDELLQRKLKKHKRVFMFDMHSFYQDFTSEDCGHIILSDRDHQSANAETMQLLNTALSSQGYHVTENVIKGGEITGKYGQAYKERVECIQVELRYSMYIEDRYFGNETVENKDEQLFNKAQKKVQAAFIEFLAHIKDYKNKN